MKKLLLTTFFVVTFFALTAVSASAAATGTVKVGLRYGSTAMFSANLENAVGSGYELGYFEDDGFHSVARTDETAISMTAAGTIYLNSGAYAATGSGTHLGPWHVQLGGFSSFNDAASAAASYADAYPAWVNWNYVVRVGCYDSKSEAEAIASRLGGSAVQSSSTGVMVTVTKTTNVLFEFDCGGVVNFGVQPSAGQQAAVTWFKGYKYYGAFMYPRVTGGNLNVINVVDLEDYVKGVLGYEMGSSWPLAALEAQSVCARTYARACTKHSSYGFDVCGTTDCQMYGGVNVSTTQTDRAVEDTAGECLYYGGALVQNAVYHSSDGGATEDGYYVWGNETGYLKGKTDPYEALTTIPNYNWTETYTADQLTWILQQKGYQVGTVKNVYVSEYTPMGNVYKITFEHSGGTLTVKGDTARSIFYSSTYSKSARSLRFTINGGTPTTSASTGGSVYVNDSARLSGLDGVSVISGSGKVSQLTGNTFSVLTSSGTSKVTTSGGTTAKTTASADGAFTLTGTGSGHNVGMSQYGAKAMAEQGYSYDEILEFYYTGISIR
jgi:stage II sporulation protein D